MCASDDCGQTSYVDLPHSPALSPSAFVCGVGRPQACSLHSGLPFHGFVWPRNLFSPGMHVPVSLFPGNWFQRAGTLNYC